jgi:DNA-binding transcriptional LysR family regulator
MGVDLTPAGVAFVAHARSALEYVDAATLAARRLAVPDPHGHLTVGLLPATFSDMPRAIIDAFRVQHPSVHVSYRELSYIGQTQDLVTGRVDVGFLWPPYEEPSLRFHTLSEEPRVLGMSDSHPLADRREVALDDILDLRFPGFHPSSSGGWFSHWFFDDVRNAPASTTGDEATTPFEMAITVQEGRAIAPAANSFARAFPVDGIRWVPISDAPPAILALAWHPQSRNAATHAFVRLGRALTEADAQLPALIAETGPARGCV